MRGPTRSFGRSLAAVALGLATLAAATAAVPAATRAAEPDLTYVATTTYTVQPAAKLIHVAVVATATAPAPAPSASGAAGGFYYQGISLAVPAASQHFVATANGASVRPVVEHKTATDALLFVPFGRRLMSGESTPFRLEFDIVDASTATDRDVRIGQTLVSFPIWAFGSSRAAGSAVSVILPAGYQPSFDAGSMQRQNDPAQRVVLASGPLADPTAFYAWLTAERSPTYLSRSLQFDGLDVTLRYWSDDPAWADAVGHVLVAGYPVLRELIGIGDPQQSALTVEETTSQATGGYGGTFDPRTGVTQVSYFADPFTTLHETAHLWFNVNLATDRWIDEGFASYYAQLAALELQLPVRPPRLTNGKLAAAIPLDTWSAWQDPASAQEAYAYAATLVVATRIAAATPGGSNGLQAVWRAIVAGRAAYQPVFAPENASRGVQGVDWRALLDVLEERTGGAYEDIWRGYIITPDELSLFAQRETARSLYENVVGRAGDWELPADIRQAMSSWRFNEAQLELRQAADILGRRDQIVQAAAVEGTTAPDTLRVAFETRGLAAAAAEASAELEVLDVLAGARAVQSNDPNTARSIGLVGADPEKDLVSARGAFAAGDLQTAVTLATHARAVWEGAEVAGRERLAIGVGAAGTGVLVVTLGFVWYRRRRRIARDAAVMMALGEPWSGEATARRSRASADEVVPVPAPAGPVGPIAPVGWRSVATREAGPDRYTTLAPVAGAAEPIAYPRPPGEGGEQHP